MQIHYCDERQSMWWKFIILWKFIIMLKIHLFYENPRFSKETHYLAENYHCCENSWIWGKFVIVMSFHHLIQNLFIFDDNWSFRWNSPLWWKCIILIVVIIAITIRRCDIKLTFWLTLFSTAFWPTYLVRGGGIFTPPRDFWFSGPKIRV